MKRTSIILLLLFLFGTLQAQDTTEQSLKNIDAYLQRAVENDYSGSVLVAYKGKILLNKGYGYADRTKKVPFRNTTVFDIGSITKQFTAAGIMLLESEKKLNVQDPISKYLKNVPEDKKNITLHELLTHTSGLTDSLGPDEQLIGREEYVKKVYESKLRDRGTYAYSNVGFSVLAAILENVSGMEYEQFLRTRIFLPAGMNRTGYVLPDWNKQDFAMGYRKNQEWGTTYDQSQYQKGVTWHLKGNGGIHSTTEDMHRWYVALQTDKILPVSARQKLFTPHVSTVGPAKYGYGWGVRENNRKETVIAHNGGNGYFMATFSMIPVRDFVVIASTNNNPKNTDALAKRIDGFLFENLAMLDQDFIRTFTGKFELPDGGEIGVTFDENDTANVALNDAQSFRLLSGSAEDDASKAAEYDQKVTKLLSHLKANDIPSAVAAAQSDFPKEEIETFFKEVRGEMFGSGETTSAKVLGSVSRQAGNLYLTAVRIDSPRKAMFQLFVWRNGRLTDIRPPEPDNIKPFERQKDNQFYAETNDKRIEFRIDHGKPAAVIGEIIALKKS